MSISVSQSLRLAGGGSGGRRTPSRSKPCVMKPFYSRLFCLLSLLLLPICFFPHVPPAFFHILLIAPPPPPRKTSDVTGALISKHSDNKLFPQNFTSFLCAAINITTKALLAITGMTISYSKKKKTSNFFS
jgi:hypothetical protein